MKMRCQRLHHRAADRRRCARQPKIRERGCRSAAGIILFNLVPTFAVKSLPLSGAVGLLDNH